MTAALDSLPNLLTLKEAATRLCVHVNTLRRWSNAGVIPSFRFGPRGDRRYSETDIRDYLEAGARNRKRRLK